MAEACVVAVDFDTIGAGWHALDMRFLASLSSLTVTAGMMTLWAGEAVPDFKLVDTNLNSVRQNTLVSPRDYLLQVSGYYFGDAG